MPYYVAAWKPPRELVLSGHREMRLKGTASFSQDFRDEAVMICAQPRSGIPEHLIGWAACCYVFL